MWVELQGYYWEATATQLWNGVCFPGTIYVDCTSPRIFNQPATVLHKAAGWMRFCAHGAETSAWAARSCVAEVSNLCPEGGPAMQMEGKMRTEDFGLGHVLFCWYLVWSFKNQLFFCINAYVPKRTGMWEHMLTFRRCSDVKVVWYRTTLQKKCWSPCGWYSPHRLMVCM